MISGMRAWGHNVWTHLIFWFLGWVGSSIRSYHIALYRPDSLVSRLGRIRHKSNYIALKWPDFLVSWLSRIGHEGASGGKLLLRIQASWTHARTAWDVGSAQARVAIITVLTTIAIWAHCKVLWKKSVKGKEIKTVFISTNSKSSVRTQRINQTMDQLVKIHQSQNSQSATQRPRKTDKPPSRQNFYSNWYD